MLHYMRVNFFKLSSSDTDENQPNGEGNFDWSFNQKLIHLKIHENRSQFLLPYVLHFPRCNPVTHFSFDSEKTETECRLDIFSL